MSFSIVAGVTKPPVLGSGVTTGSWPPAGYTSISSSHADDEFFAVTLPFTWSLAGTGYTTAYIGTNGYITFGSGADDYSPLSASLPAFPKIFFAGGDNSTQKLGYKASGTDWLTIRYEGNS